MSDDLDQQQPIIIKKITVNHGGHHGGSWKVAFADFMTAMMAFFLVLWLVGQDQKIKESVAGYFQDPIGFTRGGKTGSGEGDGMFRGGASIMNKATAMSIVRKKLEEAARKILNSLKLDDEFKELRENITIEMTPEGLRIQLIESSDSSFFESGSARMRPTGEAILGVIAQELIKMPNRIVYEGHTDATGSGNVYGYSNWDLAADRANYCRKIMMRFGVRETQIREVRSYADTRLLLPDKPTDPRNRRISILVLNDYDYLFENKLTPTAGDEIGALEPDSDAKSSDSPTLGAVSADSSIRAASDEIPEIDEENFETPDYLKIDGTD